jgi:OmpA-OmpF porin, OOP family
VSRNSENQLKSADFDTLLACNTKECGGPDFSYAVDTLPVPQMVVGSMKNKMVDAAAMAKGLGEKGHIALYGIYFDTDKAVIKPASKPTLDQIAKLLQSKPKLSVYIVGHTDNQGTYNYDMTLSRKRAAAVRQHSSRATTSRTGGCTPPASASCRRSAPTPPRPDARSTGG